MEQPNPLVDSARLGVVILSAFALVWAVASALSSLPLPVTISATVIVLGSAIAVNLVAAGRQFASVDEEKPPPLSARRRRTVFIASNVVQAVLFSVLISVCLALDELAYIPLIGSIIVGGHLIPIGLSFAESAFVAGGGLLVVTGVIGIVTSATSLAGATLAAGVVSLANAVILIVLAGLQIRLHSRQQAHA